MFKKVLLGTALSVGLVAAANAELHLSFGGLNIQYDAVTGEIYDSGEAGGTGGSSGGTGSYGDADEIFDVTYEFPGGSVTDSGSAVDFSIPVNPIATSGVVVPGIGEIIPIVGNGSGYFDILLGAPINGYGLGLDNVSLVTGFINSGVFVFTGSVATVSENLLPAGVPPINIGDRATISFSSTTFNGSPDGTGLFFDSFVAQTTGEVRIPEPGVIALLGLGLLGLGYARRKQQRS